MHTPLARLHALLLDILSTERRVDPELVAELNEPGWEHLLAAARQHRLLPLLHWRLTRERKELAVPQGIREASATGFERWTRRALLMQRQLLLVHRLLDDADIPHIALKGAYLAFHAYPHPALRPMRDLDILVPKERALRAYQLLLDNGFMRPDKSRGDLEAALETRNHLPPLYSTSFGRVGIELHTRFSDPSDGVEEPDLIEDGHLWQRAVSRSVAGATLTYLSPRDLMLHLVEHAVYHHQLDNGPLVLTDLAYLIEEHAIDWREFWLQAERHGQTRGTVLLLKMVERYFGCQSVQWLQADQLDPGIADAMVENASLLTLRDFTAKLDAKLESGVRGQATLARKLVFLVKKLFPPKQIIATRYPVSEESPRVYLWYVARWWHMLTVRLPDYLASRREHRTMDEARRLSVLAQWLEEGAGGTGN